MGSIWARWGAGRAFYENRRPLVPEDSTEAAAEIEKNVELEMDGGKIGVLQVWDLHYDGEGASKVEWLFLNNGCEKMNQTNVEESRDDFVVGNMMAFRLLYTQLLWTFHLFDQTFLFFSAHTLEHVLELSLACAYEITLTAWSELDEPSEMMQFASHNACWKPPYFSFDL